MWLPCVFKIIERDDVWVIGMVLGKGDRIRDNAAGTAPRAIDSRGLIAKILTTAVELSFEFGDNGGLRVVHIIHFTDIS